MHVLMIAGSRNTEGRTAVWPGHRQGTGQGGGTSELVLPAGDEAGTLPPCDPEAGALAARGEAVSSRMIPGIG